jgi:pyridoxal phosphate enzyme (YggS family)
VVGAVNPTDVVVERVASIRAEIAAVERPWDHEVELVAVTKGFGPEAIEAAAAAGCRAVGENYAQELLAKRATVELVGVDVQFIGRLQSNKVRKLVGLVDLWASLDRPSVVDEVARRDPGAAVLVQVNSTGEEQKGGCEPAAVGRLVERARAAGLVVRGLMTVGPTVGSAERARPGFRLVRRLTDELGLVECSMGMTADLHVAVEEGSTSVRLGTALFGPRPGAGVTPGDAPVR